MYSRYLKACWFHFKQRGVRRWITCIATLQIFVVLFWCLSFEIQQPQLDVFNLKHSKNNREHVIVARGDDSGSSGSFDDQTRSITLQDSKSSYFVAIGRAPLCYMEGTNTMATLLSNSTECVCQIDYFGAECGIPAAVWHRTLAKKYQRWKLKPRKVPRRVIHGLNINHEVDFFRVRLEELKDAVDVYIVCESNYTAHGDAKPLYLLDRLRSGFLAAFHSKIIHVPLYTFPERGHQNGWYMDMYLRKYMGSRGLRRVRGARSDDLFLLLDADEIPTREVIMFLKLYDGYPEPVRLAMRWSVFGFFWKRKKEKSAGSLLERLFELVKDDRESQEELVEVTAVSTMKMVWNVCQNNTFLIRKDMSNDEGFQERLSRYRAEGHRVFPWTSGTREHYAGYHCSWCYSPEGIRTKLLSAHADDKPRWGDYQEKLDLDYIGRLIRNGEWFDNTRPFLTADWRIEEHYAPKFVLEHSEEFSQLLYHPDMTNVLYSSNSSFTITNN